MDRSNRTPLSEYRLVSPGGGHGTPPDPREVRLAVTMVGGTSLCVYENGVAQELFRMVHGQGVYGLLKRLTDSDMFVDILSGTSAGGINTILLSTALINNSDLRATEETWVALAGIDDLLQNPRDEGVRSVLRGNDYYLPELKKMFGKLVRPNPPEWRGGSIPSYSRPAAAGTYGDLDLYVTSTYLEPREGLFFDSRNQPLVNKDYAAVFHLTHHADHPLLRETRSHFQPGCKGPDPGDRPLPAERVAERLAVIARATSCLPVIFEPAAVERGLQNGIVELWRPITYFGDGGYLNNKPINLVLPEIRKRPCGPEVLRKLVFVEPNPQVFQPREPGSRPEPSAWDHFRTFAKDAPGEQSTTTHLEAIEAHNLKVRRVKTALEAARGQVARMLCRENPPDEEPVWNQFRLQELRDGIIERWKEALTATHRKAPPADAVGVTELGQTLAQEAAGLRWARAWLLGRLEEKVPANCQPAGSYEFAGDRADPFHLLRLIRRMQFEARKTLYPGDDYSRRFQGAYPDTEPEETRALRSRAVAELGDDFRKARNALEALNELAAFAEILAEQFEQVVRLLGTCQPVRKILTAGNASEVLLDGLVALLNRALRFLLTDPAGAAELPPAAGRLQQRADRLESLFGRFDGTLEQLEGALGHLEMEEGLALAGVPHFNLVEETQEALGRAAHRVVTALAPEIRRRNEDSPLWWAMEAAESHRFTGEVRQAAARRAHGGNTVTLVLEELPADSRVRPVEQLLKGLHYLECAVYPVEAAADLETLREIELVHVTARDVQVGLSRRDPEGKLAGDEIMNLSGFFKRSWRVNDILWGRLDTAAALLDTLLDEDQLRRILGSAKLDRVMGALDEYVLTGSPLGNSHGGAEISEEILPDATGRFLLRDPEGGYRKARAEIRSYLQALPEAASPLPEGLELLREWLRLRHQLEILVEEVPRAYAEELSEYGEWQGAGHLGKFLADLCHTGGDLDERIVTLEGNHPAPGIKERLRAVAGKLVPALFREDPAPGRAAPGHNGGPSPRMVYGHFRDGYEIGREKILRDIPPVITLNRAARALLVLFQVLRNSTPTEHRSNPAIKLVNRVLLAPLAAFLRLVYGFTEALAQGKTAAAVAQAVGWIVMIGGAALLLTVQLSTAVRSGIASLVGAAAVVQYLSWCARGGAGAAARTVTWSGGTLAVVAAVEQLRGQMYWNVPWWAGLTLLLLGLLWQGTLSKPWRPIAGTLLAVLGTGVLAGAGSLLIRLSLYARWLWEVDRWKCVQVLGLPLLALLIVGCWTWQLWLGKKLAPSTIVDLELAGDGKHAAEILKGWDGGALKSACISTWSDFVLLAIYTAWLYLACTSVAGISPDPRWLPGAAILYHLADPNHIWQVAGFGLRWLAVGAGLCDFAENGFLLRMLNAEGARRTGKLAAEKLPKILKRSAPAARGCAVVKFIFLGLCLIYLVGWAANWAWAALGNGWF